ncbi:MAG: RecQ family ATP-dependent DNA helicase [Brumimicrobium sp.]|nr:RecQ family ATP-dependent DNA helicase [Brumimicrobium sp.]
MTAQEILKQYWGYDSFRAQQGDIVQSVITGNDTFALLPTGGGKSICFQVPGLARDGICIVISPLIALMQDQVKNLQSKGIKAAAITSGMSKREIDIILDNAKFGGLDFLYVSPERLKTELFLTRFKQMQVGLIAIDEAHCISQWGHDFRPPYLDIHLLREIAPNVPIIAVTATATAQVKEDIIQHLKLKNPNYYEGSFARDNISYEIYSVENKRNAILKVCEKFKGHTGIIYCQTRRETKEIAKLLLAHHLSVGIYHGGMTNEDRKNTLDAWMHNQIRIVIATNAFGMGIDKPDVRFVLHYEVPNNIEAYFQEAGRAGRDGKASRNLAFYNQMDVIKMKQRLKEAFPPIEYIKMIYRAICNHLGVAIGSGENETYDLDIKAFVKKYELEPTEAYNALKILELNDTLLLNEAAHHPTKLRFAVNNNTLYDFQIKNEKYDPIISLLSRKYAGIFSNFIEIDENFLSKQLKISHDQVTKTLQYLEKQGLIEATWQTDLPQITFLHERLPDDYMRIEKDVYDHRKQTATMKLDSMLHFLQAPICRSILLLEYFGQKGEKCGKCDICLSENNSNYTAQELMEIIFKLLQEKPRSLDELMTIITHTDKTFISGIINWMLDEDKIYFNNNMLENRKL